MSRLIDADALKQDLTRFYDGEVVARKLIDEQPTVDAVPVVHGKWIDETFKPWGLVYHPYKCDQCGENSETNSNFCPNCGAKMDGKDGDRNGETE